jgi:hypothetical protein
VQGRHQLRRRPDRRLSAALDQQLQELDVEQRGVVDRIKLVVALERIASSLKRSTRVARWFVFNPKIPI